MLVGKVMDETISWGKLIPLFAGCFKSLPSSLLPPKKTQSALRFTPQGTGNLAPGLQEYIVEGKSVGLGGLMEETKYFRMFYPVLVWFYFQHKISNH